jgi:rhamnulokinase
MERMENTAKFIAVDLGASSGRVMAARWDGRRFALEELHRFSNGGVHIADRLHWDVLRIWSEMQIGFTKFCTHFRDVPDAIGVDAWGIDFGLLDKAGRLIGNPVHYRDDRTQGIPEFLFSIVSEEEIFAETGVCTWHINTLFQLYSMVLAKDPQLECGATLLTIPDLFLYFLSGSKGAEYTEATTTQMHSARQHGWAKGLLQKAGIPIHILPELVQPGTILRPVRANVLKNCGFGRDFPVVAVASHDTASAVAAIPNMDANSAFISSGTWSLIGVEAAEPNTSKEALRLHFTNEGGANGSVLLLKNLSGLWIIQECLQYWEKQGQQYQWNDVVQAAALAEPFRSLFEPNDERFNVQTNMPAAIQEYCRTTCQPAPETVGAFARALFESLALKYRSVLESLELLTGKTLSTVRVVGGGSLNPLLCQMMADASDRTVVTGPAEASAFGNVMLQAIATRHLPDIEAGRACIAESIQCSVFQAHPSDIWNDAYARFKCLEVN